MDTNRTIILAGALVLVAGCASAPKRELSTEVSPYASLPNGRNPIRPNEQSQTVIPPLEVGVIPYFEKRFGRPLKILEISGGGQNGAFTAGLLKGWTESGERPTFDIVTGVSTGALIATHALLGTPEDDATLKTLFTSVQKSDIYTENGLLGIAAGASSLYDTAPLRALIAGVITNEVLERVAAAADDGRVLLVGTTNMDYGQIWVWNLTRIAKEARPGYVDLYRKILVASASPPVAFPAVDIDGHLFADGGTRSNLLAVGMAGSALPTPPLHGPGDIYVVNNGRLQAPPSAMTESLKAVAGKGVNTTLTSAMQGALLRSYFSAVAWGYRFHYTEIPADVDIGDDMLAFDPTEMRAAFDSGFALGRQGGGWLAGPALLDDTPPWVVDEIRERERVR